jgi:hypothetical protein
MTKKNEKYPIEKALEETIRKIGNAIAWAIRAIVKFFWVIPKRRDDKVIWMLFSIGWLLIGLGWIFITIAQLRAWLF